MALYYGDTIKFLIPPHNIHSIIDVAPVKFDTIEEEWVVVAQQDATHMMIVADVTFDNNVHETKYAMIEIGKCNNLYLLADAIVD